MVAGLRDADVCALSLWCPAPDVVYNMKHKMLCGVDVSDIEEKGYADYEGLRVGLGFYQDALELDPYAVAAKFTKRVNLVHGDEDVTASIHCSERYKEIYGCLLYTSRLQTPEGPPAPEQQSCRQRQQDGQHGSAHQ